MNMNENEKRIDAFRTIDTGRIGRSTPVAIRRDVNGDWYLTAALGTDFSKPVKVRTESCSRIYTPLAVAEDLDLGPYVDNMTIVRVSVGEHILSAADKRRAASRRGLAEIWDGDSPSYIEV